MRHSNVSKVQYKSHFFAPSCRHSRPTLTFCICGHIYSYIHTRPCASCAPQAWPRVMPDGVGLTHLSHHNGRGSSYHYITRPPSHDPPSPPNISLPVRGSTRASARANIRGVLPFDLSLFRSLDRLGIERQGDCGGAEERRARGHPLLCFMSTGVNVVWSLRT